MKRNTGIDLLKTLCAFLVICIHAVLPGALGDVFTPLTKIAVPLFFMITGYYYSNTKANNKQKSQIFKILKLLVSALILFFLWELLIVFVNGESVQVLLKNVFNVQSVLMLVLLNNPPFAGHLWYLIALLYVLLIIFFFEKKWNRQRLYPVIPLFLLIDLMFGKYSLALFRLEIPQIYVRNYFCVGLPFFLIGDMLKTREIRMKPGTAISLVALFTFTTLAERFLLGYFGVNAVRDHYISTTCTAVCFFLLVVQFEGKGNKILDKLAYIGANLSSAVYILHPIFITAMTSFVSRISGYNSIQRVYGYLSPIIIMVVTTTASWIYYLVAQRVKLRSRR